MGIMLVGVIALSEKKTARVNIRISKRVHQYYKVRASEMGLSVSSLMAVALNEYMKQEQSMEHMPKLMEMYRIEQEKASKEDEN